MKGTYKIADRIIEIDSIYKDVHDYCRGYICDGNPDLIVKSLSEMHPIFKAAYKAGVFAFFVFLFSSFRDEPSLVLLTDK